MTSVYQKVRAVERVFNQLSHEISEFRSASSLHCVIGCGKCCYKPDIEACVLEFLPFAYEVFKRGEAHDWLHKMKTLQNSSICGILQIFNDQQRGQCTQYKHRGMICRLFGFSAVRDKYNNKSLATCRVIKDDQPIAYEEAKQAVTAGMNIPVGRDYYMQLSAIDMTMANEFLPINQAITRAIEVVLSYYSYRTPRFRKAS